MELEMKDFMSQEKDSIDQEVERIEQRVEDYRNMGSIPQNIKDEAISSCYQRRLKLIRRKIKLWTKSWDVTPLPLQECFFTITYVITKYVPVKNLQYPVVVESLLIYKQPLSDIQFFGDLKDDIIARAIYGLEKDGRYKVLGPELKEYSSNDDVQELKDMLSFKSKHRWSLNCVPHSNNKNGDTFVYKPIVYVPKVCEYLLHDETITDKPFFQNINDYNGIDNQLKNIDYLECL